MQIAPGTEFGEATLQAGKRWYAFAAMLLSLLLLVGCAKNATEAPKNLNASGKEEPAAANSSTATANNNPTLKTRSPAEPATSSGEEPTAATPAPLMIPAGTPITVRLQNALSSRYSVSGQRFEAVLDEPVVVDDQTVLPAGAPVTGHVVAARRSGRLRHPGELALTLDSVTIGDRNVSLETSNVVARGGSHKKRNLGWVGGGAGGGALIGALAAGGKGALIGSGIGAVAGTTTAFVTGRKDVGFTAERRLRFRLNHELSLPG